VTTVKTSLSKDGPGVHELTDIVVEEVSLVDRAANKRKFLVVKRSSEMSTELQADGKGGFTAGAAPVDKAGYGKEPPPKDKKKEKTKKALELPPGAKEMMGPILTRATEKITEVLDMVNSSSAAEVPEDGTMPGVPEEVWAGLMDAMKLMSQLEALYPKAAPAPEEGAEYEAEGEGGEAEPTEMQMRAQWETLTKRMIQKVGAKMSKDRLSRFEQALSVLGSILGELQTAQANEPAPTMAAPAKAAGPKPAPARKQEADLFSEKLSEVTKSITGLATVVQRQAADLAAIKKTRGVGNAAQVESSSSREAPKDVSWPLDMNRPVTRDGVHKQESFFD
jgi:hypothetical protein